MHAETLTVSELARRISRALDESFPDDVWITGQISGLNRSRGGHVYFDLVEESPEQGQPPTAAVPVALFRMNKDVVNRLLKRAGIARMDNGMQIRLRGVVAFYEKSGRLQIRMTSIDPTYTIGQLAADRDRVLRLLAAEGLVDRNSRIPLPLVPLDVGLVTSVGSAAYHDFVTELDRSGYAWRVKVIDVPVQGAGADLAVERALLSLAPDVAVIAVVRGGGSRVDLAAFDSERVARAVATLDVPVLTGIGHEIDRSVTDDVAHRAYKTPTACAAGLVDHVAAYLDAADRCYRDISACARRALDLDDRRLRGLAEHCLRATRSALSIHRVRSDHLAARIQREATQALDRGRSLLDRDEGRLVADASRHLRGGQAQLDAAAAMIRTRAPRALTGAARRLDAAEAQARALDPARVLARGWSITRAADGSVIRSAASAAPGDLLVTTLVDGEVRSSVLAPHDQTGED